MNFTPFSAPAAYDALKVESLMKASVARAVTSTSRDFPEDLVIDVLAPETLPESSYFPKSIFIKGSAYWNFSVFSRIKETSEIK